MEEIISINSKELSEDYVNRILSLCRLCLVQSKELDLYSDSYLPDKKWIDILTNVTNNSYLENNIKEYPQGICEECSSKLVLFYKFKQKVATSYCTLEAIFTNFLKQDLKKGVESENLIKDYDKYNKDDIIEEVHHISEDEDLENFEDFADNIIYKTNKEDEPIIDNQRSEENDLEENKIEKYNECFYNNKEIICYLEVEEDENDKRLKDDETNLQEEQELIFNDFAYDRDAENGICALVDSNNSENIKKKRRDKNVQCEICGAKFTRNSSLKQHDTVHSLEKKFECDLCHKRFTRRAHMDTHMLIHSNIRPHSCEICSRAFTKSGDLKRHQKIHLSVYEYICHICNKEFKRKEYLTTHINSHYGVKPYKCKNCNKCYQSLSGLLKHTKSMHPVKENF